MTQDWTLEEALAYYGRQGARGEQGALVEKAKPPPPR